MNEEENLLARQRRAEEYEDYQKETHPLMDVLKPPFSIEIHSEPIPGTADPISETHEHHRLALVDVEPLIQHIAETYKGPYAGEDGHHLRDVLEAHGVAEPFWLGRMSQSILRFQMRREKKDLLKIAHYALMVYHA